MTDYRATVKWLAGTELRSIEHDELLYGLEKVETFGQIAANAMGRNGILNILSTSGKYHGIPAMLITEICYRPVEVAPLPVREPGATLPQYTDPDAQPDEQPGPVPATTITLKTCPCWPNQCTCDGSITVERDPNLTLCPEVEPEHGGRDGS